ncbi:MAG: T9SS type A sorting domain-containing protein [Bacteroidia bacterium]|nr:T9SS type A sorting domain-containing protein [Bacteroidia bacterium]
MKNRLLLFALMIVSGLSGFAQAYDTVSIYQIQYVAPADLAACIDTSAYLGDTVWTYGTVMMDGGLAQSAGGRNIWLQSGPGAFNGIDLFTTGVPTPVAGDDVLDLSAGDSVEVLGVIIRFGNETEITPLQINVISFGREIYPNPISVSDLNDNQAVNLPVTGEPWEGQYVEITNVTVTSVDPFAGGARVSFYVSDASGSIMNISDRFIAQRLPGNGGTFVPPNVGTVYDTIRGVLVHSSNGCFGANGRGYEMFPFDPADYVIKQGFASPQISNITRNPVAPTSSQDVNVSATVTDADGTVTSATLFYAVGLGNTNYFSVPMTANGSTYTGTIPNTAFSDGDLVKYYVCADDNDNLSACNPDVGGNGDPLFFFVRDNGVTIYDVQFAPFANDNTGYANLDVTLTGIVTATSSTNDLGYVYIQQPGETKWAGLSLTQNQDLNALSRGDEVQVSGTIIESFDMTTMVVTSVTTLSTGNPLPAPIELDPALFTTYGVATTEPYESMIVTLVGDNGADVYVVDENADNPNNFAEYRVGKDQFDPAAGTRVIAGRVSGTSFSSLAFSYVNSDLWVSDFGIMTVPACVVSVGDTISSLSGIMYHSFGNMKLLPRNNADAPGYKGANCPDGIATDGIEDLLGDSKLVVFPNPARELVTLRYELARSIEAEAVLIDLMGREVAAQVISGTQGELSFHTEGMARGTYLLSIRTNNEILSRQKVVLID